MGYQVLPEFTVVQHERDAALLHRLRTTFQCGVVRRNAGDRLAWRVRRLEHLAHVIVPFFERHRLRSKKAVDFERFAKVIRWMERGDHLRPAGILRIAAIAATMNRLDREALLAVQRDLETRFGGRESPRSARKAERT